MTPALCNKIKWIANVGFIFATIAMLSPAVAAKSVTPWIIYFVANGVWMWDSVVQKNKAWIWLALFFCAWDVLLILTRMFGVDFFAVLQPLVKLLEMLP